MKSLSRSDLRRYQVVLTNKIKALPSTILAVDMGSGKTASTLTAMVDLLDDGIVTKVLVVAPLNVARATWSDEIDLWEHTRDISYTIVRAEDDDDDLLDFVKDSYATWRLAGLETGPARSRAGKDKSRFKEWKRRKLVNENTEIHIINREALAWLWDYFGKGKNWPYDALVIDEASMFKNGKMRTPTKALTRFGVVAKARKHAKKIVQLTGTPAPKGLINLWGLSYIADGGERLGNSKFKYEQLYFDEDYMGFKKDPKPWAFDKIMGKMDNMFSLPPEFYPDVPPNTDVIRKVTLPRKMLNQYKDFEAKLYSEEYEVEAVNKGVLHNKLLQFANGSMYDDSGEAVFIHDEKLWALEDIYEEANGQPILVAYSFKFDLARIKKHFKKAVVWGEGNVKRQKDAWNAGDTEMLVAHAHSIGHGQNIQHGGNIAIWYGLNSDLEIYQQFNKRLNRPGQTKPVFTHHILTEGTLDMDMIPILTSRGSTQSDIMRAVEINIDRRELERP